MSPGATSSDRVLLALQTGPAHLIEPFLERVQQLAPDLPLYVISEFPPPRGRWIPFRLDRTDSENLARARAEFGGRRIHLCAQIAAPNTPYVRLRRLAWRLAPLRGVYFNESLNHYMLRPRSLGALCRTLLWRLRTWVSFQIRPGGDAYTFLWRLVHPSAFLRPLHYRMAVANGEALALNRPPHGSLSGRRPLPPGIAVVIPSRDGRDLLSRCLPPLIAQRPDQIIVVDNGSSDDTAGWLRAHYSSVEAGVYAAPLSFAAAVNRGLALARYSHVLLLNNDMEVQPGFLAALRDAFQRVPGLFCATAQILFPEGQRREETGKAVAPAASPEDDFPLSCAEPLAGEDLSEVLYGSGGCSLYDLAWLRALSGFDEGYVPAYVEDLDVGYRGWLSGGATVFVAGAQVLHRHRSTTSRYFTADEIRLTVERNYLRFLANRVGDPAIFRALWDRETSRLNRWAAQPSNPPVPAQALRFAAMVRRDGDRLPAVLSDRAVLALGCGDIFRFPGLAAPDRPRLIVASCYSPFPLAHGGAVRMYNLMRRAAAGYAQTLLYFADSPATPPDELRAICEEVVVVRRYGRHRYARRDLPDVVQDFESEAFREALRRTVALKRPFAVQLEFTQLAQYAADCAPARTILVEHDITIDLYRQLLDTLEGGERWHIADQLPRWEQFERRAWQEVDTVVTMSDKDRDAAGPRAIVLPNGVDLDRFVPGGQPEPGRLLFIGSFAHLPNLLALDFFLGGVWPRLSGCRLHVIAGQRPDYYLDFYKRQLNADFHQPGIEVEGFIADVRPAYRRAEIVIAPLIASAGTNIKILEAMAMGKAIVSTPAGVNGLDVQPGHDAIVVTGAESMAAEIRRLLADSNARQRLGAAARQTVVERYGWDALARRQAEVYEGLRAKTA